MRHFLRPGALAAIAVLLAAPCARADDNWSYQPSLKQDFTYESNPLLVSGSHQSIYGSVTTPQLVITDNTPTSQLTATGSLAQNIFNVEDFNSTDAHLNINYDKKLEQWEAGFIEQTDYDTTRTSEITTFNTNAIGSVRHLGNSIAPQISYSPTSIDKLTLAASAMESTYDSSAFTDYHIFTLAPSYQRSFTPMDTGIFSVQAQRYQTETSSGSTVDGIAPTLGWIKILSPTLTAKATVGAEAYRQSGAGIPDQQWSWQGVYTADLTYKGQLDTLSLDGVRALEPYANGTEFFLNTLSISEAHVLNMLFTLSGNASYEFAGDTNQAATNLKSLVNAGGGLTYHATDQIDLSATYTFRQQQLTNVTGDQYDNLFLLTLVFHPKLDGIL